MNLLVTGGGSDIGRAIVKRSCDRGHRVWFTGSSEASVAAAADRFATEGVDVQGAVLALERPDEAGLTEFLSAGPDGLVLNAWTRRPPMRRFHELPFSQVTMDWTANLTGNAWLVHTVLPRMLERGFGRIVFISSVSAVNGTARYAPYVAAKAGLEGLMRSMAQEYGRHGILANTLRLGMFQTERTRRFWSDEGYRSQAEAIIPQGRMGTPDDVGRAIDVFLDEHQYINGAVLDVGGGLPMFNLQGALKL